MSFLYDRTITVFRSKTVAGSMQPDAIGGTGYSGRVDTTAPSNPEGMTTLFAGIQAGIQAGSSGGSTAFLPGDASAGSAWKIYTYLKDTPKGSIRARDLITDDDQNRYIVQTPNWQSGFGYELSCKRLEA